MPPNTRYAGRFFSGVDTPSDPGCKASDSNDKRFLLTSILQQRDLSRPSLRFVRDVLATTMITVSIVQLFPLLS